MSKMAKKSSLSSYAYDINDAFWDRDKRVKRLVLKVKMKVMVE